MIRVQCPNCNSMFDTDERYAGMKANCTNCQAQILIPLPSAPATGTPAPSVTGTGTAITVQSGMLTDERSMGIAILLWFFLNGIQYFYLGQIGKGIIFTCIDAIFVVIDFITCGMFALVHGPWRFLWLIDTILVTRKLGKRPVSKWRFF